ncbi:ABC-F family ATP-binding cassette domain-containing protein [Mumia zhuanghuii]|uniref:ABC-F family ATP-binding cassette domain-containing protein n=1 Tax=Mumia zhuanghuii TaxID=2585211 RepID=A0A5C4MPE5_9ACTN|nr:ABC-F family ATP-binding cassette domain-containing protein [Mumia zhuanghuii]TNC47191.1 ABC-F family ATP-binding cassette domain-containing protein [Mumia zhuanghuii]
MHTSPHSQLALHDVSKTYDERRVIDRVSLTVKPGEKVGVVGDNGSGKSTLLRLLAGHEHPDDGEVTVRAPGGIGHLAQALDLPPEATVRDAVDVALADLRTLESAMHALEDALTREPPERFASSSVAATYATLTARYEARGGYEADVRVGIALHGLGLPDLDPARPTDRRRPAPVIRRRGTRTASAGSPRRGASRAVRCSSCSSRTSRSSADRDR